jgi:RNA polymerase sigma factor (sigma-70 family)
MRDELRRWDVLPRRERAKEKRGTRNQDEPIPEIVSLYFARGVVDTAMPADEALIRKEKRQQLLKAIRLLEKRDRQILLMRIDKELNLADVGKILGVHECRICQLEKRAQLRLAALLNLKPDQEE